MTVKIKMMNRKNKVMTILKRKVQMMIQKLVNQFSQANKKKNKQIKSLVFN